jgi:hypothetical protein
VKYCLGTPYLESRPLHPSETLLLDECRLAARRRKVNTLVLAWGANLVLLLALIWISQWKLDQERATSITAISLGFFVFVPAATYLLARDANRRLKLIERSAATTSVDVFVFPPPRPDEAHLVDGRRGTGHEKPLVQVPETGLILNTLTPSSSKLMVAEAAFAAPPRIAPITANASPKQVDLVDGQVVTKRALTSYELSDLEQITKRLTQVRWWSYLLVLYSVIAFIPLFGPHRETAVFRAALFGAYDVLLITRISQRLTLRKKLKADIKDGAVIQSETRGFPFEFLPSSKIVWTRNGEPVDHRKIGRGLIEV